MRSRIVGTKVGLDLYNPSGEKFAALSANKDLAEQIRSD
jgi:hypothetical protein